MDCRIFLIGAISLIVSVSSSSLAYIEKTYVKELQENIERIPALLSGYGSSPKINVNLFRKLSEAMNDLKTETLGNTFVDYHNNFLFVKDNIDDSARYILDDYDNFLFVKDNIDLARYIWDDYNNVVSFFEGLNEKKLESADTFMDTWRFIKPSKRITHDELERLNSNLSLYIHLTKNLDIPMCTLSRSRQQVLHDYYNTMTFANLMATVILAVSECTKKKSEQDSSAEFQKFFQRQNISYERAKRAIAKASRALYACDPIGDDKMVELGIFEIKIGGVNFTDCFNPEVERKSFCCAYEMPDYRAKHYYDGSIISVSENITFCKAPEPNLPAKTLLPYGEDYIKSELKIVSRVCQAEFGPDFCIGTMFYLSNGYKYSSRYFHLGNAISDVDENKVVTGVKLYHEDAFFYIQIQQGKLGPNDSIVPDTVEWKPVDNKIDSIDSYIKAHPSYNFLNPNEDFYNVLGKEYNAVYLDDITHPNKSKKRYAVTGLRFIEEDKSLKLEVETSQYDYATGRLHGRTEWFGDAAFKESRSQLDFKDPIAPIHYERQYEISKPGQFVQFQGTTPKQNLYQTTIPYIDLQEIVTNPPSPVAGAGILVKGTSGSGGYLSLKLITHDIAPPEL